MEAGGGSERNGGGAVVRAQRLAPAWARWRSRLPRFAVIGCVLILSLLGLRELIVGEPPAPAGAAATAGDAAAEDFALQFARAYLGYDAARPEARERALAAFLPRDLDPDGGFAPAAGRQRVVWAQVASNQPALAGGRVITVAAQTTRAEQPIYLAVTVRRDPNAGLALIGYPAFVGAPSVELEPGSRDRGTVEEPAVVEVAGRVVRNYLAGALANLRADLSDDAVVTVPTLALRVTRVEQVVWTGPGPESGAVLVTVSAADALGGSYRLTYELGLVLRERPYVDFIQVIPNGS